MTIGYYLGKPIFLLHKLDQSLPSFDEIMALQPIVIKNNLKAISNFFIETRTGFEPVNSGFADRRVTTSPPCRIRSQKEL